jgi:hypothetical protein
MILPIAVRWKSGHISSARGKKPSPSPFPQSPPLLRPDSHDVVLESVCNDASSVSVSFQSVPGDKTQTAFRSHKIGKGDARNGKARRGTLVDIELI